MPNEFNVDDLSPNPESTSLSNTPSDDGIEIEIDPGKKEKFTRQQIVDFYKGHLRQDDYTRKTQEIAEQRKQIEQFVPVYKQLVSEREQIAEFLKNKELLLKYVAEQFPDEKKPSKEELEQVVNMKTLEERERTKEATLQKQIQHLEQQLQYAQQQGYQQLEQRIKDEIETAQYSEKINAHLKNVFDANPVLQDIDNIEDILRYKVFQAKPANLDATLQLFDQFAKELTTKLSSRFVTSTDTNVNQPNTPAAKPAPKSIEPPGKSSPPPPKKKTYKNKDNQIDWDSIGAEAEEVFRAMNKG